jgi:hypothetical protein
VIAKNKLKLSKLEVQIAEETDKSSKQANELNEYRIYLPEAESLLQEVNKRH